MHGILFPEIDERSENNPWLYAAFLIKYKKVEEGQKIVGSQVLWFLKVLFSK